MTDSAEPIVQELKSRDEWRPLCLLRDGLRCDHGVALSQPSQRSWASPDSLLERGGFGQPRPCPSPRHLLENGSRSGFLRHHTTRASASQPPLRPSPEASQPPGPVLTLTAHGASI